MHLNRFDLNLLIALDALLQEKNVTRAAERVFADQGLDVRVTANSLLELPFMLPGTPLIATVPESVAKRFTDFFPVKIFAPPVRAHDNREVMLWHKRNEADPGHAWLRELFIEAARDS